ncbi:hypothetical protein ACOMHN_014867 [Nucella lapillus]
MYNVRGINRDPTQKVKDAQNFTSSGSMAAENSFSRPVLTRNWENLKKSTRLKWGDLSVGVIKLTPEDPAEELSQSDTSLVLGLQESFTVPQVSVEGKVFFICDNTPTVNYFVFMKTFLRRYGFFLTSWTLPEKWAMCLAKLVYIILWLLYPFLHINPPVSKGEIHEVSRNYTFSKRLAQSQLHYTPLFTLKESLQNTMDFYDREYKHAMSECLFHQALGSQHVSNVRYMSRVKKDILSVDLGDAGKRFRAKASQDNWVRGLMV